MKKILSVNLVLLILISMLPIVALAEINFNYNAAVENSHNIFQSSAVEFSTTDSKGITFYDACLGKGSITDTTMIDTRAYWTIYIVNPDKKPAHLEMKIGFNADSPLFVNNTLQTSSKSVKGDTLTFSKENSGETITINAFDIDTTLGYILLKPEEAAGYIVWTIVVNDELETLLQSSDAFPLSCTLKDQDVSIPMILTTDGAEDYKKIINIYDDAAGKGTASNLLAAQDAQATEEAEKEAQKQQREAALSAKSEEQPKYLAIFPKAALDYYFMALKNRDPEAFIQCTQFTTALTESFTTAAKARQAQNLEDHRVETLDYLRRAVIKCFGKQVKSARNDKPETYFNMVCVTQYPKGYKKYSVAIFYPQDDRFTKEIPDEVYDGVDVQAIAVIRINDQKKSDEYNVLQINGQWYVYDYTVIVAYSMLQTDSLSVSLLKQLLAD